MTSMTSREFNQDTSRAKKQAGFGPVHITYRGQPSHVLLSIEDYRRLVGLQPALVEILCETPGVGDVELELPLRSELPRPAQFD